MSELEVVAWNDPHNEIADRLGRIVARDIDDVERAGDFLKEMKKADEPVEVTFSEIRLQAESSLHPGIPEREVFDDVLDLIAANPKHMLAIDLGKNGIGAHEDEKKRVERLGEVLGANTYLVRLNLSGSSLGSGDALPKLLAGLAESSVVELLLYNNALGTEGAKKVSEFLGKKSCRIQVLSLRNNMLGPADGEKIGEALKSNKSLRKLNLRMNLIGDEGCKAIAGALKKNRTLTSLSLFFNGITMESGPELASMLRRNKVLQELDLGNNTLGAEGGMEIADALASNTSTQLIHLSLYGNQIKDEAAKALLESFMMRQEKKPGFHDRMTLLHLGRNGLTEECVDTVCNFIRTCPIDELNLKRNHLGMQIGAIATCVKKEEVAGENTKLVLISNQCKKMGVHERREFARFGADFVEAVVYNTQGVELDVRENAFGSECEDLVKPEMGLAKQDFEASMRTIAEILFECTYDSNGTPRWSRWNRRAFTMASQNNYLFHRCLDVVSRGSKEVSPSSDVVSPSSDVASRGSEEVPPLLPKNFWARDEIWTSPEADAKEENAGKAELEAKATERAEKVARETAEADAQDEEADDKQGDQKKRSGNRTTEDEEEQKKAIAAQVALARNNGPPMIHHIFSQELALANMRNFFNDYVIEDHPDVMLRLFDKVDNRARTLRSIVLACSYSRARKWATEFGTYLSRYQVDAGPPEHMSDTCVVFFAKDIEAVLQNETLRALPPEKREEEEAPERVAIKVMRDLKDFENELDGRDVKSLSKPQSEDDEDRIFIAGDDFSQRPYEHTVQLLAYHRGEKCIVMELSDRTLFAAMNSEIFARGKVERVCGVAWCLAQGIAELASKGLVHCDIKPRNVLRTESKSSQQFFTSGDKGRVGGRFDQAYWYEVSKFGIVRDVVLSSPQGMQAQRPAKVTKKENERWKLIDMDASAKKSEKGHQKCSSAYMPPEMAKEFFTRKLEVDPTKQQKLELKRETSYDVWSFGVILYELLSGTSLFLMEKNTDLLVTPLDKSELINWIVLDDDRDARLPADDEYGFLGRDLVRKCLIGNPDERIRIEDVLAHPFVRLGNPEKTEEASGGYEFADAVLAVRAAYGGLSGLSSLRHGTRDPAMPALPNSPRTTASLSCWVPSLRTLFRMGRSPRSEARVDHVARAEVLSARGAHKYGSAEPDPEHGGSDEAYDEDDGRSDEAYAHYDEAHAHAHHDEVVVKGAGGLRESKRKKILKTWRKKHDEQTNQRQSWSKFGREAEELGTNDPSARYHFFLSHVQREASEIVKDLWLNMRRKRVIPWLDVLADDLTLTGMHEGIKHSQAFVLVLTRSVLFRPYCLNELLFAIQEKKKIIYVKEADPRFHTWNMAWVPWIETDEEFKEEYMKHEPTKTVEDVEGAIEQFRYITGFLDSEYKGKGSKRAKDIRKIKKYFLKNPPDDKAIIYRRRYFETDAMVDRMLYEAQVTAPAKLEDSLGDDDNIAEADVSVDVLVVYQSRARDGGVSEEAGLAFVDGLNNSRSCSVHGTSIKFCAVEDPDGIHLAERLSEETNNGVVNDNVAVVLILADGIFLDEGLAHNLLDFCFRYGQASETKAEHRPPPRIVPLQIEGKWTWKEHFALKESEDPKKRSLFDDLFVNSEILFFRDEYGKGLDHERVAMFSEVQRQLAKRFTATPRIR